MNLSNLIHLVLLYTYSYLFASDALRSCQCFQVDYVSISAASGLLTQNEAKLIITTNSNIVHAKAAIAVTRMMFTGMWWEYREQLAGPRQSERNAQECKIRGWYHENSTSCYADRLVQMQKGGCAGS